MKTYYRIVADAYNGHEVQYRPWFWPFWIQAEEGGRSTNTHRTMKEAEAFALMHSKNKNCLKNLGVLP